MEKELKIAELANIWGVSVPTCWNRIKKEGLTTIKKKDETNKDITYITISDNLINKKAFAGAKTIIKKFIIDNIIVHRSVA